MLQFLKIWPWIHSCGICAGDKQYKEYLHDSFLDLRMVAHPQVVIGAPDSDVLLHFCVFLRQREIPCAARDLLEDAVRVVTLLAVQLLIKELVVLECQGRIRQDCQ